MGTNSIQRIATTEGVLVPFERAIKFTGPVLVTDRPTDTLAGNIDGLGQVTGYVEVTFDTSKITSIGLSPLPLIVQGSSVQIAADSTGAIIFVVGGSTKMRLTSAGLAFFAATPAAQAARVGQIEDDGGGSPGTSVPDLGLGSPLADTISTILAKLNAIELLLHNYGLTL
jgi:hypothetical protein